MSWRSPSHRRRDILNRFGPTPSDSDTDNLHPPTDFHLARFSLGLANEVAVEPQPLELFFHSDFTTTPQRPLSPHSDHSRLAFYNEPPRLAAPPPPGVRIDMGRIDVVADEDDPEYLSLLQDQIQWEYAEAYEHQARAAGRPTSRFHRAFTQAQSCPMTTVLLVSLPFLLRSIVIILTHTPPTSPTFFVPLFPQILNITMDIALLCPILFFNPFLYPTIGGSPDLVLGKRAVLDKSFNVTNHLLINVSSRIWDEEFHPYQTRGQKDAADQRLFNNSMEFAGVKRNEIRRMHKNLMHLVVSIEEPLRDIRLDFFSSLLDTTARSIGQVASNIADIDWTPEDDLFIGYTNTSAWIPRRSLPKEIPPGIRRVLDLYRIFIADRGPKFLDISCKDFLDCKSTMLTSAPTDQKACFSHKTSEAMMEHLAAWAFSVRDATIATHRYTALARYLITLAQLKDVMEQAIQAGETMNHAKTRVPVATGVKAWVMRWRDGLRGQKDTAKAQPEQDYVSALREIIQGPFWRQFHDAIQGMLHVGTTCGKLEAFSELIDSLYSPTAWIIDEDGKYVQLWKLPSLLEQQSALNMTRQATLNAIEKLETYRAYWNEWETLNECEEEKWMELWLRNRVDKKRSSYVDDVVYETDIVYSG